MVKYGDFIHRNGGFIAGMWVKSGKMMKKNNRNGGKKKVNVVISGDIW